MDFYEVVKTKIDLLSNNEMKIYEYIVDNFSRIHKQTIREVAKNCYVSTSTIIRVVKKIGFTSYSEMIVIIKYTNNQSKMYSTTISANKFDYREEYMKNIMETIRVMDQEQISLVVDLLLNTNKLYIYSRGLTKSFASYLEFLFKVKNVEVIFPTNSVYRKFYMNKITNNDTILLIDYHGNDQELIDCLNQVKSKTDAYSISITQANNNVLQNLSDINFYYFSDELTEQGIDITSNISVIAILEIIIYNL